MPLISTFYGLIIRLYFYDNEKHHLPHLHVEYTRVKNLALIFKRVTCCWVSYLLPSSA